LAAALQAKFGPDVALVGKAVALISMMAQNSSSYSTKKLPATRRALR
jgi:hypothetical protein